MRTSSGSPAESKTLADHVLFLSPISGANNGDGESDDLKLVLQILEAKLAFMVDEAVDPNLPVTQAIFIYHGNSTMITDDMQVRRS